MRYLTAGESHGPRLTAIIEGIPAGLPLTAEDINEDLKRRQGGYGRGGRMKIESDQVIFTSGVRHGKTTGAPITMDVINKDHQNGWILCLRKTLKSDLKANEKSPILDQVMPTWLGASSTVLMICVIPWSVHQLVKPPCGWQWEL